ncbi:hypothetical protein OFB92_35650, partial [Escherichia coli]|nr:hypothetical protein [Escherichia coli]
LYFLKAKYYQPQTVSFLTRILASFDALICLSEMQSEFAQELMVGFKKSPRIFTAHELVSKERMQKFLRVRPNLKQKKILF